MNPCRISVVIPTHNRRELLREMLARLAVQSYPVQQLQVIVVIDGGQDGTLEMLQGLDTPYQLCPVYQEQAGVSAARNHGARLAQGGLLLFLDDDLLPALELVAEHARIHGQDPGAVVLGRFLPDTTGSGGKKQGWNIWEERVLANHYRAMTEGRRPPAGRRLYSGNFSVGRANFLEVGGFDERLKRGEDVELGFRLEAHGLRFYFNPSAAAVHRGYRSFESWSNSAYLYGRTDILLATERGFPVLPEVLRWYRRQPPAARRVVGVCLGRKRLHKAVSRGLRAGAGALTRLRLHSLAHLGYSGVYKLQYWQGVSDALGGPTEFLRLARPQRQHTPEKGPTEGQTPRPGAGNSPDKARRYEE